MNKGQITLLISVFLLCGSIYTIATKLQNTTIIQQSHHHKLFFHPYMQSFSLFIFQSFFLILYYFDESSDQQQTSLKKLQQNKQPHTPFIFIIPALAEAVSSCLSFIGLFLIDGSMFMIFKGAIIIFTAIFSKILLGTLLHRKHYVGCALAFVGVFIVAFSVIIKDQIKLQSQKKQFLGYFIMTLSIAFSGFFYAYEQKLVQKYSINPFEMIGYQGLFGSIFTLLLSFGLSMIPCHFGKNQCVYIDYNIKVMQSFLIYFKQIFSDEKMTILFICAAGAQSIFYYSGLRITIQFDALLRSLLNIVKTILIWFIGILITINSNKLESHPKIESLDIKQNIMKVFGFILMIIGTLVYNETILLNCMEQTQQDTQDNFNQLYLEQKCIK